MKKWLRNSELEFNSEVLKYVILHKHVEFFGGRLSQNFLIVARQ